MSSHDDLKNEIGKWTEKLDREIPKIEASDDKGKKMLENLKAYRADSEHFSRAGDLVRSFECLVWAWSILEIGKDHGHLVLKV